MKYTKSAALVRIGNLETRKIELRQAEAEAEGEGKKGLGMN